MKRILTLILALCMVLALAACGAKDETPKADAPAAADTPKSETPKAETPAPEQKETAKWPNGDITILAGYAVGSLTDVSIRIAGDYIEEKTGAQVKYENNDVGGGANLITKLAKAKPDGQTLMYVGMNTIMNYYNGTWSLNPSDWSQFKIVCSSVQPYPNSGCMVLTQADSPYSTWDELAKYAEEHPGEVTVASIAGKVMDTKMKALFNGTGVSKFIRWAPTSNAEATAGLLGGQINCVMLDEITALGYLKDGSCKALINCRIEEDYYDTLYANKDEADAIRAIPSLVDLFGKEKAEELMVPNRSMFIVPADTPDEICEQIRSVVDGLADENEGYWLERKTVAGGTSTYYPFDPKEVMAEWERLNPILKQIVETK